MPPHQTVMIHVREDNGMGDIMLCVKTMKALKQKFPDMNIQISVETRTLKMEDVVKKIKDEGKGVNIQDVFAYNQRPPDKPDPALVIIMPAEAPPEVEAQWSGFQKQPERLMMKEYAWGTPLQSGGLSDGSLGIFLEDSLSHVESTQTDGKQIDNLSSKQVKDILLDGKPPEKYADTNKLYFGYAHLPTSNSGFLKSIMTMNEGDSKNVDFFVQLENCIPGIQWNTASE